MATYDIRKIENWLDEFKDCSNQYKNNYYSDFKDSYLNLCSDSVVFKIKKSLAESYEKINDAYTKIDIFWSEFLSELIATDNSLAEGKIGKISSDDIINKLKNLPNLEEIILNLGFRLEALFNKSDNKNDGGTQDPKIDEYANKSIQDGLKRNREYKAHIDYLIEKLNKDQTLTENDIKKYDLKIDSFDIASLERKSAEYQNWINILENVKYENGVILYGEDKLLFEAKGNYKDVPGDGVLKSYGFENDTSYINYENSLKYLNTDFEKDCMVFSKYISKERVKAAKNTNIHASIEVIKAITGNNAAAGFNDGTASWISVNNTTEVIVHENMHHLSNNDGKGGIQLTERYRGINEGVTDYFTKVVMDDQYPNNPTAGYPDLRNSMEFLVDEGVIDNDTIANSYFNNDIEPMKDRINEVAGNDKAFDELVDAFQDCHDTGNTARLDEECAELIEAVSNK